MRSKNPFNIYSNSEQNMDANAQFLMAWLARRGVATPGELMEAIDISQPTLSRTLAQVRGQVLALGSARARRYGVAKSIHGLPGRQAIHWINAQGRAQFVGELHWLAGEQLHLQAFGLRSLHRGQLPWWLAPLRAQGFLGRALAQQLAPLGLNADPERWNLEAQLLGALQLPDAPGAVVLGEPRAAAALPLLPESGLDQALDTLARQATAALPAGSSAAGEQPKFLARRAQDGQALLVKFSPPHGTPFGDRWGDLLQAEALAAQVLAAHGVPVARCTAYRSATRSYLLSERFDRLGVMGRRHGVSLHAAHAGLSAAPYRHWAQAAQDLVQARRLSDDDARRIAALRQFGQLIGNSDMHGGNLSLWVEPEAVAKGLLSLAPVYDMLPMRWRPDAVLGGAPDYQPFDPDPFARQSGAWGPARDFWHALAQSPSVSAALRQLAAQMLQRL
jgi:HipA-like C-terminal domain